MLPTPFSRSQDQQNKEAVKLVYFSSVYPPLSLVVLCCCWITMGSSTWRIQVELPIVTQQKLIFMHFGYVASYIGFSTVFIFFVYEQMLYFQIEVVIAIYHTAFNDVQRNNFV